jgi:hypothetical protein
VISIGTQEGMAKMDEAGLSHIAVGVGVSAVLLGVAAMIAQHAML